MPEDQQTQTQPTTQPSASPSPFAGGTGGNQQQDAPQGASQSPAPAPNPMLSTQSKQEGVPPAGHLQSQEPPNVTAPEAPAKPQHGEDYNFDGSFLGDLKKDSMLAPVVGWLETELTKGKVDTERAFGHAVERGDASLIDSAYLREKLGDGADAVINSAKQTLEYVQGKAQRGLQEVYQKFGGEDAAKSAAAYFNANADAPARAAMKQLLDSGNTESIEYAIKHITEYARNAGHAIVHNQPTLGQPTSGAKGISAAEYHKAIQELPRNTDENSPEYQALVERRRLGKQLGM